MFSNRRTLLAATAAFLVTFLAAGAALAEDEGCLRIDMEVTCTITPSRTILVGDPFTATATVRNTGDLPLDEVVLALRGGDGVTAVGTGDMNLRVNKLAPGEEKTFTAQFVSNDVGERRITASARDKLGWAAAGCWCGVLIKGLPAIQVEMVDVDINRAPKGIFEVGEQFIYTLTVENDVGTAVTPDLKVVWELPAELEFVSGVGDRGATVTGSGRQASSSSFLLARNQVQNFEVTVRVVSVPGNNLIQTGAKVITAGDQVLAQETESTTLKNKS